LALYLIEVSHSDKNFECKEIVKLFVQSGSQLLANCNWGCKDGVHKAWFISDFDTKEEALMVVPPLLRRNTMITQLNKFTKEDIAGWFETGNR
jgi:hypothetical protein